MGGVNPFLTMYVFSSPSTFYHRAEPDLELQALFKRHFTHLHFYQGSVLSSVDLERVKVSISRSCKVLITLN